MSADGAPNLLARILISATILVCVLFVALVLLRAAGFYKIYYMPAESMEPTLHKNDRFASTLRGVPDPRRGDIVVFRAPQGSDYVKRVAALPGDRIAVMHGIVILNGHPIPQRFLGTDRVEDPEFGNRARRFAEQFPGESEPHMIYDVGSTPGDDFAEQRVAPGHVFVLGDNRDHSADSRYPVDEMGVEQVPVAALRGRVLFFLWSADRDRIGRTIH